jgi:GntR family transcriptional regulator/MocR family aminotransferase
MRALYSERRDALISALRRECGDALEIAPAAAGMHLLAWLPEGVDDRVVAREAEARDVQTQRLSAFAPQGISTTQRGGLLLGYAAYNEREMREAAAKLADALRATMRPARRASQRTSYAQTKTLRREG